MCDCVRYVSKVIELHLIDFSSFSLHSNGIDSDMGKCVGLPQNAVHEIINDLV
jgi:hypothetical protein